MGACVIYYPGDLKTSKMVCPAGVITLIYSYPPPVVTAP